MEDHPCLKIFSEISFHNARLVVLGQEAFRVLEDMRKKGMPNEVHDPLFDVATKAAGLEVDKDRETIVKEGKRCKW